jgi:hypothetical protein
MRKAIDASVRLYDALIILMYPADLQRRYGSEMREVFQAQLTEAWAHEGACGFIRIWFWVIAEALRGPAPSRLIQALVSIPMVSVLSSSLWFLLFYRVFYYVSGLTSAGR